MLTFLKTRGNLADLKNRLKFTVNRSMRVLKYLVGMWAALAVYALCSFLGGPRGLSAYNNLLEERERQWENLNELGNINEGLEKTRNSLLYDDDTLMVYARQMGYGQEDERFVRIVGLGNVKATPAVTGTVYTAHNPEFTSDKKIKIAALCAGLLVFSFFLMLELIESKSR